MSIFYSSVYNYIFIFIPMAYNYGLLLNVSIHSVIERRDHDRIIQVSLSTANRLIDIYRLFFGSLA